MPDEKAPDGGGIRRAWGVWKAKGRTAAPEQVTGPIDWERRARTAEALVAELEREKHKYVSLRGFLVGLMDPGQLADMGQNTPDAQKLLNRIKNYINGTDWERRDTWKNFNDPRSR